MRGGEPANSGEKFFGVNDHAARALQEWLNNYAGNLVAALNQKVFEFVEAFDVVKSRA